MTNISKFHYLKMSVISDVALLLNRFKISPESYDDAWKMLLTEYDDKRALIHTHLQSFICFPKGKSDIATELKKLRDTVSVALAVLSNMGCQISYWDSILVFIITEKLGSKTRAKWNLKRGNTREYVSYQELDTFLSTVFVGLSTLRMRLIPLSIIREIKVVPSLIIYRFKNVSIIPAYII